MSRKSLDDVRGAYKSYCDALDRHGYDVSEYRLQLGDASNSYRSLIGGAGTPGTGSYGHIGDTSGEAYRSLIVMSQLLDDLRYK